MKDHRTPCETNAAIQKCRRGEKALPEAGISPRTGFRDARSIVRQDRRRPGQLSVLDENFLMLENNADAARLLWSAERSALVADALRRSRRFLPELASARLRGKHAAHTLARRCGRDCKLLARRGSARRDCARVARRPPFPASPPGLRTQRLRAARRFHARSRSSLPERSNAGPPCRSHRRRPRFSFHCALRFRREVVSRRGNIILSLGSGTPSCSET